jgi:hypothetical protein
VEDAAFPSNSREPQKKEKLEKVVVGEVVQRKPGLGRRFRETFGGGDAKSVGQYIFFEVLVPALKDTFTDMVSQGVERMIYGEARSSSRRTGHRPSSGSNLGHVSYNRYATPPWRRDREEPREERRPKTRTSNSIDEIVLATRVEADEVLGRMFDVLSQYGQVTVGDLYELVGLEGTFTDQKWGWTDLRNVKPLRVRDGYLLDLPRPEQLD